MLKKTEWQEADCRVTVLTPAWGKIQLLCQGARKAGAKLKGHIEPGMVADISFVAGRAGYRLTSACMVASFFDGGSWGHWQSLRAVLHTLDRELLEEAHDAYHVYTLAHETLSAMMHADATMRERLRLWFAAHLLLLLGLLPDESSSEGLGAAALVRLARERSVELAENSADFSAISRMLADISRARGGENAVHALHGMIPSSYVPH